MLTCDEYHMPTTLAAALELLQAAPADSRLVAGATDILPWAREGRAGNVNLPAMIDLSRVEELHGYEITDGRVRLGANVVYQQFLTDPVLREHLPYVTHDQSEALTMSDRVAVFEDGIIQQLSTPEELYERPKNSFGTT